MSLQKKPLANISARMGVVYCVYFMIYSVTSPYLQLILRRLGYGPAAIGLLLGFYELVGIAGPIVAATTCSVLPPCSRQRPFSRRSGRP